MGFQAVVFAMLPLLYALASAYECGDLNSDVTTVDRFRAVDAAILYTNPAAHATGDPDIMCTSVATLQALWTAHAAPAALATYGADVAGVLPGCIYPPDVDMCAYQMLADPECMSDCGRVQAFMDAAQTFAGL